jgi:hypothetical protein
MFDSLEALQNCIYGPPCEQITISLITRIRNIDDEEAEFLLTAVFGKDGSRRGFWFN